jgi:Methane oxygenase PmoA
MTQLYRISIVLFILLGVAAAGAQSIKVVPHEARTRVDVEIDGKLFTSYRWDEKIRRPVLFPIMSAGGNFVTRGFPIETRDNETINHPHQVGSSFSYGDVNGIDFWNNSTFRTAKELERMGRIVLKNIVRTKSGNQRGELVTTSIWLHPSGKAMLNETTKLVFNADGNRRWLDRETTLTAAGEDVVFGDNKEGLFAIHLNVLLQQEDQFPVKVTSASGELSDRASKEGLTGKYFTSEGLTGNAVWGMPARWGAVSGRIGQEDICVAVFDSPKNLNFPSNAMVRPYGLLALNPFGQRSFVPEKQERKYTLQAKRSVTFRHRVVILSETGDARKIEAEFQKYIK